MVPRHPQLVAVYDVGAVCGIGISGDGFQQWSPSAQQDTWAPQWSGGATDAKAWEQMHWSHDEDQYFLPDLRFTHRLLSRKSVRQALVGVSHF